jgi:hypothetical protein
MEYVILNHMKKTKIMNALWVFTNWIDLFVYLEYKTIHLFHYQNFQP